MKTRNGGHQKPRPAGVRDAGGPPSRSYASGSLDRKSARLFFAAALAALS